MTNAIEKRYITFEEVVRTCHISRKDLKAILSKGIETFYKNTLTPHHQLMFLNKYSLRIWHITNTPEIKKYNTTDIAKLLTHKEELLK